MNAGPLAPLIRQFDQNWRTSAPEFAVSITDGDLEVDENHPLYGELLSLCSGRVASLPFFSNQNEVVWCTVAPDSDSLRQGVASLHAWVLPSFGGERVGDGYVQPVNAKGALAAAIISAAPDGYYRWRCPRTVLSRVCDKLRIRHSLESIRPARTRPPRPSLYELRARFASALLVGDRNGAEETIQLLDSLQLETAVNTQFMRIRMWHHFREHERIRTHPDLPHLLAQPLPPRVRVWIDEALGVQAAPEPTPPPVVPPVPAAPVLEPPPFPPTPTRWAEWFLSVKEGNKVGAQQFLQERSDNAIADLTPSSIDVLVASLEELYLDDTLRARERSLFLWGITQILDEFVREPGFPRASLGSFYLALLRVWCALHAGTSIGQEHGHVLLELASAALQLNLEPDTIRQIIEAWWDAKPAPSQLYYALDAIELLERELPGTEATANLWIQAADVIKRSPDALPPSDRALWRRVGGRLGFDAPTIARCLPAEPIQETETDLLAAANLKHIAIVCLREEQAAQAATVIRNRSGAKVTVVTATAAGAETAQARGAEVVLFVWMASTHSVFRAFDGYDRKRFCYVQGTGASSIVRTLERWVIN